MKKQKIYIIQMHTGTIPSKIIKLLTRYKYSHICLSFDRDCSKVYSFGRKKINWFLSGGFTIENKDGEFFKKFNKTYCRVYELNIDIKQYYKLKQLVEEMSKNKDIYKYDYLGIILRYFHIPISFKDKYVCSFFIADILEKSSIYKFNKKTCLIKPKDFESLNGSIEIYQGEYSLL